MRFIADHDFHIHTTISPCCRDEAQTPERLLQYARDNGYKKICITNHFWDNNVKSVNIWHPDEYFEPVSSVLPLPKQDGIDFLFGCEADMDYNFTVGIGENHYDDFDFIVISTTHLGLVGHTVKEEIKTPEEAADIWLTRLYKLLEKDLPWHKTGIAHLTTGHIYEEGNPCDVVKAIPESELYNIFKICAQNGVGIELNIKSLLLSPYEKDILLKPFKIAKDCGCKFYLGSDSHNTKALETAKLNFEDIITELDLEEKDKHEIITVAT